MSRWTARAAAKRNAADKTWTSNLVVQTTNTVQAEQEGDIDGEGAVDQTEIDEVEWSVGKVTLMNLWAMLFVCLCGNAVICFVTNRNKKPRQTVSFHHDEHESRI